MKILFATEPHRFSSEERETLHASGCELRRFDNPGDLSLALQELRPDAFVIDDMTALSQREAFVRSMMSDPTLQEIVVITIGPGVSEPSTGPIPVYNFASRAAGDLLRAVDWGLSRHGKLRLVLANSGVTGTEVISDRFCEWARTPFGIVGVVRVEEARPDEAQQALSKSTTHAYSLLDALPEDRLAFEDLWNLLLFVSVTWTDDDLQNSAFLAAAASRHARDTVGSRKIVLLKGKSPLDYIGALKPGRGSWSPISGDPLRDALNGVARNETELAALQVLFKRRISEEDLDQLIRALGQGASP